MSNVVDFKGESEYPTSSGVFPQESELYFTAVERDLYWRRDVKVYDVNREFSVVPTHKMLLRRLDDSTQIADRMVQLAIVGSGYQLVQNQALFQSIEEQFMRAFDANELADVRVKDSMSYGGRVCLREYQFPNVRCDIGGGVSDIAFRTIVKNGFGGSSIVLYTGAIDFFCTNGMIGGQFDCMYARHTKGLQITDVTDRVRRSIDVFYKQADIWRGWRNQLVSEQQAKEFFEDMFSDRLAIKLYRQFLIDRQIHGHNMWALYSAMTYYASHDEGQFETRNTGVDHSAVTLLKREEQVQRTVASDAWSALAA